MKTNILGVQFDNVTVSQAADMALAGKRPFVIYTPNPEIVRRAQKESSFCDVLNSADLVVPDGIGIVYASRILKGNIKQRAAGFDIVCALLDGLAQKNAKVYLFGGKPGVAKQAAQRVEKSYPGIRIVGAQNGYFDEKKEEEIIADIKTQQPDLLLVCLGAPKQEKWIMNHKDELGAGILIGAGGSIDVLSGNTKRAPEFFQKHGLEWFYRLLKEPKRIGRMISLPFFLVEVFFKRGRSI